MNPSTLQGHCLSARLPLPHPAPSPRVSIAASAASGIRRRLFLKQAAILTAMALSGVACRKSADYDPHRKGFSKQPFYLEPNGEVYHLRNNPRLAPFQATLNELERAIMAVNAHFQKIHFAPKVNHIWNHYHWHLQKYLTAAEGGGKRKEMAALRTFLHSARVCLRLKSSSALACNQAFAAMGVPREKSKFEKWFLRPAVIPLSMLSVEEHYGVGLVMHETLHGLAALASGQKWRGMILNSHVYDYSDTRLSRLSRGFIRVLPFQNDLGLPAHDVGGLVLLDKTCAQAAPQNFVLACDPSLQPSSLKPAHGLAYASPYLMTLLFGAYWESRVLFSKHPTRIVDLGVELSSAALIFVNIWRLYQSRQHPNGDLNTMVKSFSLQQKLGPRLGPSAAFFGTILPSLGLGAWLSQFPKEPPFLENSAYLYEVVAKCAGQ